MRLAPSPHGSLGARSLLLDLTPLDTPTRHRGNGRYLRELAQGLAALPAAALGGLRLFALTRLDPSGGHEVTDDLAAFAGSPSLPRPGPRDHYRWAYARRFGLWRALLRLGPGAVHLGDPNATPLFTRMTGTRTIVTCHDMIPLAFPEHYLGWRDGGAVIGGAIERRRYRKADKVIAISDATRRDLRRFVGLPASRVVRIHNGVDVPRWAAEPVLTATSVLARHDLGRRPFAIAVGAADWHKNPEGTVAGLAAARRAGADVDLAWAGRLCDGHRRAVERAADTAGVGCAVRFLGFVPDEDLAVLYRAAIAHVLVSRSEGFGLTIVEAMASGCAVVTTHGGSLAEVAGDAAIAVDPDDAAGIGRALVRLAREPELRADLGARGRARASRFSREAQARAMIAVYRSVVRC